MIELKNLKHLRNIIIEENFYTRARTFKDELDFKSLFIYDDYYNSFLKDFTKNYLRVIL